MIDASFNCGGRYPVYQRQQAGPMRDAAGLPHASPKCTLLRLGDLVADHATDGRSSGCSQEAAADHVTRDPADDGPSGSAFLLR